MKKRPQEFMLWDFGVWFVWVHTALITREAGAVNRSHMCVFVVDVVKTNPIPASLTLLNHDGLVCSLGCNLLSLVFRSGKTYEQTAERHS